MNILIISPSYKPSYVYGGPIKAIASLCEGMVLKGHKVDVFTTNANGQFDLDIPIGSPQEIDGVPVTYFRRITKDNTNFSPQLLFKVWRSATQYDAVHVQYWWNMVSVPTVLICLSKGIIPVVTPRGSLTHYTLTHGRYWLKRLLHIVAGRKLLNACIIHTTTDREWQEAKRFISPLRHSIISNMVQVEGHSFKGTHGKDRFRVLFLGRIHPVKNLELLLAIFAEPFSFPIELVIAGIGEDEYVARLQSHPVAQGAVRWVGFVESDEKWDLIMSSDALVLPSHTENFGNVVLEALQCGVPVIVSNGVGLKDFILEHDLGKVLDMDIAQWRKAIGDMYNDPEFRARIRERGPALVKRQMSSSLLLSQYEDLYIQAKEMKRI